MTRGFNVLPRATAQALLVAASVLLFAGSASAQDILSGFTGYVGVSWTVRDGLSSGDIRAIAQDKDGYLWLGTNEGLTRFDGSRFLSWDALGTDALPERRVLSLLSASDGSLWVGLGGAGGITRLREGRVRNYGERDGIAEDFVRAIIEDREGTIWAAGRGGLFVFHAERWEKVGADRGVPDGAVETVLQDRSGTLWISTRLGILRRMPRSSRFELVDNQDTAIQGMAESSDGSIWVTDRRHGFRLVGHVREASPPGRATDEGSGVQLLHDSQDALWVATSTRGLWRVNDGAGASRRIEMITTREGLSGDAVRSLLEDRDGNIWVGTTGGLHRFARRALSSLGDVGVVRAVETAESGGAWIGSSQGLIEIGEDGTRRTVLQGYAISALHLDSSGALWAGTNQGVLRHDGALWSKLNGGKSGTLRQVVSMGSSPNGAIWLCDREQGVFTWRDGSLSPVPLPTDLARHTPYSVYVDRRQDVWVAFSGGVAAVLHPDGSSQVHSLPGGFSGSLRTIYEDRAGTLWFGGDDGLSRYSDGRFVTLDRGNGLPGNAISAIGEDRDGYLWVGGDSGLLRLARAEFDALAADPGHQLRYRIYSSADGAAGEPLWRGSPSTARSADGRIWFVTSGGVTIVNPATLESRTVAPGVRIDNVTMGDQRTAASDGAHLPPLTPKVRIEFSAPAFGTPLRYRYKLEGFDRDWVSAGFSREAIYTNLPPRAYEFRVSAATPEGDWNDNGGVWRFSVQPAFYQTVSFFVLCGVALIGGVWLAWQLRLRQIKRQFSLVLAERMRMSREIHDTLLQNLVGVALQFAALSTKAGQSVPELKPDLTRIRILVEEYIRDTRKAIAELRNATHETGDLVATLRETGERATAGLPVRFEVSVSGQQRRYPQWLERQILRIGQEAIHNAARHAQARRIRLEVRFSNASLCLRVFDDGCGFDITELPQDENRYGLVSMRERAHQAGANLSIRSDRGKGTLVELKADVAGTA